VHSSQNITSATIAILQMIIPFLMLSNDPT